MANFIAAARLDIAESLRARWFIVYALVFGGLVAALFVFGLTESRVMGFTGLSRLLVTYIQLSMAILPVFVLVTTVRSLAGDRESGNFEYMLALPVPLSAWYWGRFVGRFVIVFLPVFLAMIGAVGYGALKGADVPWLQIVFYTVLLVSLTITFLGIGFLISSLARSVDIAQGAAFVIWLVLLLFLDLILLGVMVREQLPADLIVTLALLNPLQVFRTGAMMLFDPQLVLLGPSAYVILDAFGQTGYIVWSFAYPAILGLVFAAIGYWRFKASDLV
ncbi:MAG: ABC transporter permease subunit [Hyphomicrobiales bacterium]|nr:ABC transporter permease subunit [Hyphomicrobiales bacterium]